MEDLRLRFVVAVVVVFGLSADQFVMAGTSCDVALQDDDSYKSCMKNLSNVFSANVTSTDDIYQAMCSPEGRDAFTCFYGFYVDCPELAGSAGVDPSMFSQMQIDGGMDVACEVLVGLSADQFVMAGTSCDVALQDDDSYKSCMKNLSDVFSGNLTSTDDIYQAMCSPEGRDAFTCFYGFYVDCPALAGAAGVDPSMFSQMQIDGGMDVACEVLVGPCKDLQKCMTMAETIDFSSVDMSTVSTGLGAEEMLPYMLVMMCGPLKEYVLCFFDALEDCPNVRRTMEQFTKSLKPDGDLIWPDFTEMRTYMTSYCTMEGDFKNKKTCVDNAVKNSQLKTCIESARMTKSGAADTSCSPYFAGRECAVRHIGRSCGEDAAKFYATGLPFVYTEFKGNCETDPPVGGTARPHFSIISLLVATFVYINGIGQM